MHKKRSLVFQILTVALLVSIGLFLAYRYMYKKPDAIKFIEEVREQNKAGLDSLQKAINYENDLNYRIKKSISTDDFKTAYSLMDSLPSFGKKATTHLYRGMVFAKQKKYSEAIEEYNISIKNEPFPIALDKRAEAYLKMNKLDSAMSDYKKAYSWNYDYSLQVASTFELMKKKDSALKYYQIYSEHYPNDQLTQQKIEILKSH